MAESGIDVCLLEKNFSSESILNCSSFILFSFIFKSRFLHRRRLLARYGKQKSTKHYSYLLFLYFMMCVLVCIEMALTTT